MLLTLDSDRLSATCACSTAVDHLLASDLAVRKDDSLDGVASVTSELVPVWFQSSSLGAVDAIDSRCAAAVHLREARRRHHLSRQALEDAGIVSMSTRFRRRNWVTDGFVSVELGSIEILSVDSTVNFISGAAISVLDEVVAELVEF
jgi:hypothetical protein